MGYNCWVTRSSSPGEPRGGISRADWDELVSNDDELAYDDGRGPESRGAHEPSGLQVNWIAHPDPDRGSFFEWDKENGRISAQSPDIDECRKLLAIAQILDARLVGEEGEELTLDERDRLVPVGQASMSARPWWRRLLGL